MLVILAGVLAPLLSWIAGLDRAAVGGLFAGASINIPPPFIKMERWEGKTNVTFAVEMQFDFASGQSTEWQRLRIANFE